MFQSTYNFRISVKEDCQVLPLNIYTSKDIRPVFDDLVNKIQKHINLNHYSLVANNKNIIYDDKSLRSALTFASGDLEIILQQKSLPVYVKEELNSPDTIPTIVRWSPPVTHTNKIQNDNNCTYRKDSGIPLGEPPMKKRNPYKISHLRKLPYPPSPTLANSYNTNTHFIDSKSVNNSPSESSSSSSTSSKSSLYNTTQNMPFKLPAITAITDCHIEKLDAQLAPIYSLFVPTLKKRRHNPVKTSTDFHICNFRSETGGVCGLSFRRPYDLSRHKNTHLKNRPFSYCEVCSKKFTRIDALRRHERVQGHNPKRQNIKQQLEYRLSQT